jgi:hypothetical protein
MPDTVFITDDGIKASLNSKTGKSVESIGTGKLRLYKVATLPSNASLFADFVEADFPGYAAVVLVGANWTLATVAGHIASASYPLVNWTRNATGTGQNIYGWYITDGANTKLYACAQFTSGPFVIQNNGDAVNVTITLSDKSLN